MAASSRASTRRYLKGEVTRAQILDAAKKLFTTKGYNNTSIYDVFDKAAITKGAFYHHWSSKEDLAVTILEEMRECYQRHLYPISKRDGKARDLIEQTLKTLEELNERHDWYACRLMAVWTSELSADEAVLGRNVHQMRRQWIEYWTDLIGRAQAQDDLRKDIPKEELSFLVVSTISGVFLTDRCEGISQQNPLETLRKILLT